jgi:transcriptional regulator with PAS, ATPase and Fis domain
MRVGGTQVIRTNARIVAATNKDLRQAMQNGTFRDDLYYRLNVINIHLPPLRERREDVPLLAQEFLDRLAHELGREVSGISEEALRLLMDHDWPGNVRELENAIERALVSCKSGVLGAEDFAFLSRTPAAAPGPALPPGLTLQDMEKQYIAATLARLAGNVKAAAEALGIDRSTLYEKIKRYEIPR